ncbi:MAG: hypothetical protein ACM3N5_13995 [Candidatus Eiseniibacteriota bacterium]
MPPLPLGDIALRGYAMAGHCQHCLRVARLDPAKLAKRTDPRLPVSALRGRLRCTACRGHRIHLAVFRFETDLKRWLRQLRD